MVQSLTDIRNDIENTKSNLFQTVNELEDRLGEMKDWRSVTRHYPFAAMLVAFGFGLVVSGTLTKPVIHQTRKSLGGMVSGAVSAFLIHQFQGKQQAKGPSFLYNRR